jgi:thiamine pyrophosphate-dependent acetolactate synthase large subunit-like protein
MRQMNKGLAGWQRFHPKEAQWRQMIAQKAADNVATIKPQVEDDTAPGGYYRLSRDIAAWMPRNSVLSAEGAGTMDIGLTMLPSFNARSCLNAGTCGTMGVGLGQAIAAAVVYPDRPVVHLSGDSAIGFGHGDGDAVPLQFFGQDRRPQQWRHRPGHARDRGKPDDEHEAELADLGCAL